LDASSLLATFGGDVYDEYISAERTIRNPLTGVSSHSRPLYPNSSRYQNFGLFGQGGFDPTSSLRVSAGVRGTGVRFATREDRTVGVLASSQWFRDVTYHTSVRWQIAKILGVHGIISRGFRTPNLNDLGALGLNDLGYEIPAADPIPADALLATDAGENALSKNELLSPLKPESLINYEVGLRVTTEKFYARVQLFDAELYNPIVRHVVISYFQPARATGGTFRDRAAANRRSTSSGCGCRSYATRPPSGQGVRQ
jgi:outer membrane receptor protein involved in Fe transport